jgi:hypothetical protein
MSPQVLTLIQGALLGVWVMLVVYGLHLTASWASNQEWRFRELFCHDRRSTVWTYGMCNNRVARCDVGTGLVQTVLWKAGEQGHTKDCWVRMDSTWWPEFIPWED